MENNKRGFSHLRISFTARMSQVLVCTKSILARRCCYAKISILGVSIICTISCQPAEVDKAEDLINMSIEAHGGMERWKSLDTFSYRKEITLYDTEKKVRKFIAQQHDYTRSPQLEGRYSYFDSIQRAVVFDGKTAYKIEANTKKEADESALKNFSSAYYVLNMPWKLHDEGAHATYQGLDTLFDGRIVEKIKVEYTSGITKDLWWYYFDTNTHRVVACLVSHPPTYNLITNDAYATYQGLLWNHKRSSYRADKNGDVIHLLGTYVYVYPND